MFFCCCCCFAAAIDDDDDDVDDDIVGVHIVKKSDFQYHNKICAYFDCHYNIRLAMLIYGVCMCIR